MKAKDFWNKEYAKSNRSGGNNPHLALSTVHAEDLEKFTRYLERNFGKKFLNVTTKVLDMGCGNGRNLIYLCSAFNVRGFGYDISDVGIREAKKEWALVATDAQKTSVEFQVLPLSEPIPLPDASVMVALDMMASHVLLKEERIRLRDEVLRVLKPEGWLFFKSFLLDDDSHAKRLLREKPAEEDGMYVHPEIGTPEYVWTEDALRDFFEPHFKIHKIEKSFKHKHADGSAWKRRTIVAYLQKEN